MGQEITVYIILAGATAYVIYMVVNRFRRKKTSRCDGCDGCSLKKL
ncbi:MAG: FeoB-associated Cys-rich membrane protein [Bacteroidales bacterium]|nr:FeoB-associated Cys-rich membrane protein [Bacteroidales bacterium]